jgi:hypothetical protein
MPVWRSYFLYGRAASEVAAVRALGLTLGIGALYLLLLKWKKRDRLFKTTATPQRPR